MKMKQKLLISSAAIAMTGLLSTGVNAAAVDGNATAELIEPLVINETNVMNFGTLAAGSLVSTVVMDTSGGLTTPTGDATIISGTPSAGAFTISGESSTLVDITISSSGTLTNGSEIITVDNFTDTSLGVPVSLDGSGGLIVSVGATLNLAADQAGGTYTTVGGAPFTVTVNYN